MANANAPRCPKPERLRELIDRIQSIAGDEEGEYFTGEEYEEVQEALCWLATSLENRNLYHKKQNLKKKILTDLARERGLL